MRNMGDLPKIELFGALLGLHQNREYADLTITTKDGRRHKAHRAILCPRSRLFKAIVDERRWRNDLEGEISLTDDDPEVVRLLIEYFYILDYEPLDPRHDQLVPHTPTDNSSNSDTISVRTDAGTYGNVYGTSAIAAFGGPQASPFSANFKSHSRDRSDSNLTIHALPGTGYGAFSAPVVGSTRATPGRRRVTAPPDPSPLATSEPHLTLHARMYAAAEKYGIHGLKVLALDKFKIQLTRHWDSFEFAEAIHIVYSTTPATDKDMREAVADSLGWHSRLLDKPEIEVAVMEINGLAYELLKRSRRAEPEYMD
ncbi:hypothetical protein K431DRAFT_346642 [Polychaeton citri CBS 116435]|uniref:BTB domain-containing protein n=1 Tax=Polychaeton citri CBS 116435 TaxID=1314669 RepID=A0A9P4Q7E3_9PEZI|nr:hypothetical protein K431DRAFT_346642 [Polychaeton citri CBS 116435]